MKFRVFHKFLLEYVDPNNVSIDGNGDVRVRFGGFVQTYPNNDSDGIVVEMSTGLVAELDNTEIYEGDILRFAFDSILHKKNENFAVVYNKEFARFELQRVKFTEDSVEVENDPDYYDELKDSLDLIHCEKTLSQERYNLNTYVKTKLKSKS